MSDAGIFLGFGSPIPGRELRAAGVFEEAMTHFTGLRQRGEIESLEAAVLEPHGGELGGFLLLRGEASKLAHIRASADFQRLLLRAQAVATDIGVVSVLLDAAAVSFVQEANRITADLTNR